MSSAKSILVTGGAGFIGSHIVDMLLEIGHKVTVFDNLSTGFRENLNPRADLKVLDICSSEARAEIAKLNPEVVIHAAAQVSVRVSMADPSFDTKTNLVGLVNILQSFPHTKLPYFMFLCTGGALYGEQAHFPASEDHPINPTSYYGLSKHLSEQYLEFWRKQFGLKYVSLRLANVYGPKQNTNGMSGVVAIFIKLLLAGQQPTVNGSGEQTRDYVYIADVVNAFKLALKERVTGSYNIGTAKEVSVNELLKLLEETIGVDSRAHYAPAKSGEQDRSVIDPTKAGKSFNWKPDVKINDGLKKTVDWFRAN